MLWQMGSRWKCCPWRVRKTWMPPSSVLRAITTLRMLPSQNEEEGEDRAISDMTDKRESMLEKLESVTHAQAHGGRRIVTTNSSHPRKSLDTVMFVEGGVVTGGGVQHSCGGMAFKARGEGSAID